MTKTTKIDITALGSFESIELARWCLNTRFYQLAQVNGCNYQIKCLVAGQVIYLDYLYEESTEPLKISFEIQPNNDGPNHKSE